MKRLVATLLTTTLASPAFALPQDGVVTQGNATISQNADTLNIHQNSDMALIDWRTFNIGSTESVNFLQPGSNSLAINRVGESTSFLDGNLTANGRVWLFNPHGIIVGQGAQFNTGSLVLSAGTFNEDDESWQAGSGDVTNNGTLNTEGNLTLLGTTVTNNGTLTSNGGTIQLLAAQSAHVPLTAGGLITAAVAPATTPLKIENTGAIITPGGTAQLAMQAVDNPTGGILNTTGVIAANTVGVKEGKIILGYAPQTTIGGTLSAQGNDAGENGGTITVTGHNINLTPNANLNASAVHSGNGGQVIVVADNTTRFHGNVEAKGGSHSGNGGFMEISGKKNLIFRGNADASAAHGARGTLLLDPEDIIIADGAGPEADDAEVADGTVLEADGGAVTFTIAEQTLEAIAAGTDIHLEATRHITVGDLTDNTLGLATTGNVTFVADSDLNGTGNFSMNAGDTLTTGGANLNLSGANLTLGNLDTSAGAGGAIALTTTGSAGTITYGTSLNTGGTAGLTLAGNLARGAGVDLTNVGAITLAGNSTIQSGAGAVVMDAANTINGAHTLTVTAATDITLPTAGNSTPLTGLTANAGGTLTPLGNITTNNGAIHLTSGLGLTTPLTAWQLSSGGGNITLDDALTLAAATTLNSGGGAIQILDTINGGHTLTLNSGAGNTTLSGALGGGVALTSLAFTGNQLTTGSGIRTTGAQTYNGAVQAQGTLQSTAGTLAFNDDLTLTNALTLTTGSTGNITLGGEADGAYALALNLGTGTATINGILGANTPLASLAITGASDINAAVTTSGNQTYTGNTDIGAALSAQNITTSGGAITLRDNLTASDDITLNGSAITLAANSTLQSGGAAGDDITLGTAITGANTLGLNAGSGNISLQGIDIGTLTLTAAAGTTLGGNVLTDTAQDWSNMGALTLGGNVALTAGNGPGYAALTLGSGNTIAGANHNLTLTGSTVGIGAAITNVNTLAVTGAGGITVDDAVNTNGTQTYTGPLILAANLTTSNDDITVNGDVTLAANTAINSGAGIGNISLNGTVDGAYTLALTAGTGGVTVGGNIGDTNPLTSLTLSAATANLLGITTTSDINLTTALTLAGTINSGGTFLLTGTLLANTGAAITAADDLTLTGAVTLADDLTLTSGGGASHLLTMGNGATGDHTLTLTAGAGDLALTGNFDLDALTIASGNDLTYGGGTISTDNAILFTALDELHLSGDTVITAADGGTRANVTMGSANLILATTPGIDLSIYGDIVTLYGVGDNGAGNLATLTINAATAVMLGNIYTTGAQTITATQGLAGLLFSAGGDITLNTAATLVDDVTVQSNGGNVYFNNILNGNHNLSVDAGLGNIYVNANLGDNVPLASVSMNGSRVYLLGNLTTQGSQQFTGEVFLGSILTSVGTSFEFFQSVTLLADAGLRTLGGGGITFHEEVNGPYNLLLGPGTGHVTAHKALGGTNPLGLVSVVNSENVTFAGGLTAAGYTQSGVTGLTDLRGPGITTTGNITIESSGALLGSLSGEIISVQAQSWVGHVNAANSLNLATGFTNLEGTVAGTSGRQGALGIALGGLGQGPHYFNGYNLPLPELAAPSLPLGAAPLAGWDSWGAAFATPVLTADEDDETTPLL